MPHDYPQFWTHLLQRARARTTLHSHISPRSRNWLEMTLAPGLKLSYFVPRGKVAVALYIDRGTGAEAENLRVFEHLLAARERIEGAYGAPLLWERLEGRRACRITGVLPGGGLDDVPWPELQEAMVGAMIRFEAALRPFLAE